MRERYGEDWDTRLSALFAAEGLPTGRRSRSPSTRLAHRLTSLARAAGREPELRELLFAAVWVQDRDVGDPDVLLDLAARAGLDAEEARAALADEGLDERLTRETQVALQLGARGVPAWVIDDRVLVPGNQPPEVFDEVMRRLGHSPRHEEERP